EVAGNLVEVPIAVVVLAAIKVDLFGPAHQAVGQKDQQAIGFVFVIDALRLFALFQSGLSGRTL
ncbi:MAG: hypothetical protein GWN58_52200, partial [Anaerolineae bacterium]|nr:hypothetical protein [Anaerolineae bacterium]